jgi:hypothetical protein
MKTQVDEQGKDFRVGKTDEESQMYYTSCYTRATASAPEHVQTSLGVCKAVSKCHRLNYPLTIYSIGGVGS